MGAEGEGLNIRPREVNENLGDGTGEYEWLAKGLMAVHSTFLLVGAEGGGKTLLNEQLVRQLLRGEDVFDLFPVARSPKAALLIDTEMGESDHKIRNADFDRRGLKAPKDSLFKAEVPILSLDNSDSERIEIEYLIQQHGIELLWLEAGSDLVSDPSGNREVAGLFSWINSLYRETGLLATLITHHNRKTEGHFKKFDDVFGSRQWKGKPHIVAGLEGPHVVVWKDRPGTLGRMFPSAVNEYGSVYFEVERPGYDDPTCAPFVWKPLDQKDRKEKQEAKQEERLLTILRTVGLEPDQHSGNALLKKVGGKRETGQELINQAREDGLLTLGQNGFYCLTKLGEDKIGFAVNEAA